MDDANGVNSYQPAAMNPNQVGRRCPTRFMGSITGGGQ
jgi:hypothetical protein